MRKGIRLDFNSIDHVLYLFIIEIELNKIEQQIWTQTVYKWYYYTKQSHTKKNTHTDTKKNGDI